MKLTAKKNKDGENHNNSWNCGVEGPSQDPNIIALRYQQKRNLLALLFLLNRCADVEWW